MNHVECKQKKKNSKRNENHRRKKINSADFSVLENAGQNKADSAENRKKRPEQAKPGLDNVKIDEREKKSARKNVKSRKKS